VQGALFRHTEVETYLTRISAKVKELVKAELRMKAYKISNAIMKSQIDQQI
jgi:hypothetical protein